MEKEKAVIYARFSSRLQKDTTIETQLRRCREYAAQNEIQIVGVYSDKAKTGMTADRESFQKMIDDSKKGDFGIVLVHKTDRFSRGRYEPAVYKYLLQRNGVRVVSATEFIPDTPEGVLLEKNFEGAAAYYSMLLSVRVKDGYDTKTLKGFHNGQYRYGYDLGKYGYVINEEEAELVRLMYERRIAGDTYKEIEEYAVGYKNKYGNPIRKNAIRHAIHAECYKGVLCFRDIRLEGGIPAIVDEKTWESAQRAVARCLR